MHNHAGLKNMRKKTRKTGPGQSSMGEYLVSCPRKGVEKKQGAKHAGPKNMCKKTRKTGVGESLMVGTQSPGKQTVQKGWATRRKGIEKETRSRHAGLKNMCEKTRHESELARWEVFKR
jgi:hypothetical protein